MSMRRAACAHRVLRARSLRWFPNPAPGSRRSRSPRRIPWIPERPGAARGSPGHRPQPEFAEGSFLPGCHQVLPNLTRERPRIDRFGNVPGAARLEATLAVARHGQSSQRYDRNSGRAGIRLQLASEVETTLARQLNIHQDEIGLTPPDSFPGLQRSEEHTSELQSHLNLVCRLLLEKKKKN